MNGIEELQKLGQDNFTAAVTSAGEVNKSLQAIASEVTDYAKKAFEHGSATLEKLVGAKTAEQALQIQTEYARTAYENYVAEVSKIGEMCIDLAKDVYKPVEVALANKA